MANPSLPAPSSSFESLSSSLPSSSYPNNDPCRATRRVARRPSLRSMQAAPTAADLFCGPDSDDENKPGHFLDACSLCKTPLHVGDDIYMYRGDTPFCSEECRQEQIDIDEAQDRNVMKKNLKYSNTRSSSSSSSDPSKTSKLRPRAAESVVAV